jgi:hypothetical protein
MRAVCRSYILADRVLEPVMPTDHPETRFNRRSGEIASGESKRLDLQAHSALSPRK